MVKNTFAQMTTMVFKITLIEQVDDENFLGKGNFFGHIN